MLQNSLQSSNIIVNSLSRGFFLSGFSRKVLIVCDYFHLSTHLLFVVWRNSLRIFLHILVISLRALESILKISYPIPKPFLKKASSNKNGPTKEECISSCRRRNFKMQVDGCWGCGPYRCSSTPSGCSHRRRRRRALFPSYCA